MADYIIDNTVYNIGKDTDGNNKTNQDLHALLLKMVLEFDRVCRKNNIPYALAFGSALGAYNYAGFIPMDDDIDIAIDYFDIPRFIEAFKRDLSEDFTLDCYENNKRYNVLIPTMKFRYKNSYIKEANNLTLPNRCKNGDGFFIDVVAFMGVPKERKEHVKLIKKSKRLMPLYVFLDGFLRIHPYGIKKKLKKFESEVANKYKDSEYVSQTVIIPFQDWGDEIENISWKRDIIYPFKEYDFCGHKLYSFNDLKGFCSIRYGEKSLRKFDGEKWYDPYPVSKRKMKHIGKYNLDHQK